VAQNPTFFHEAGKAQQQFIRFDEKTKFMAAMNWETDSRNVRARLANSP
jgi:hypothetical protein